MLFSGNNPCFEPLWNYTSPFEEERSKESPLAVKAAGFRCISSPPAIVGLRRQQRRHNSLYDFLARLSSTKLPNSLDFTWFWAWLNLVWVSERNCFHDLAPQPRSSGELCQKETTPCSQWFLFLAPKWYFLKQIGNIFSNKYQYWSGMLRNATK